MDVELQEIRDHMGRFPPFDALSDELLDAVAESVEVRYFREGSDILEFGQAVHHFGYVRSGAVEVYRHDGQLFNRISEGDIFGYVALLRSHKVRFPARAIEDTLVYFVPEAVFERLCDEDAHFADFVELSGSRLKATVDAQEKDNDMLITRVRRLIARMPVMIDQEATAQAAARLMTEQSVSSLLVLAPPLGDDEDRFTDGEGRERRLVGILTDQDLRIRLVAEGRPAETPVRDLLAGEVVTVQSDASVNEAMLTMLRNHVHHLPVLHRRRPVGVVHLSDIVRYETRSGLYLVSNIYNQPDERGLARLMPDVRAAFVRMVDEGADSKMVGSALSTIGRSLTRRLIELAEAEIGQPPIPYCFMVLGSMARNEQSIVTDQDNALVLDDRFDPEIHGAYFAELARRVSDGLDACGYPYCKGGIMATNPDWRQPLSVWQGYFSEWIEEPDPQRLLHSSIFFDLDPVHGEERFVEVLQDQVAAEASANKRFLAAMARNALNRTPPLGFFRTFVMEQDGKQNNSINLKRRGTAPMADLVRVHALACGSTAQNSFERLDDIDRAGILPAGQADKLRYALEFIAMVRIRHQVIDLKEERPPDNNIEPENVSASERHNLKEAFQVLSNAQKFLRFRYPWTR